MEKAVGQDFLPKLFEGQESHGAPPGYYFLTTFLLFPPLLFLLRPTWQYARSERSDARVRFLLAWLVPAWLLFELVPTKLPHYVLPLMTPLVLLAAQAQPRVGRVAAVVGSVTSVLIAGLICGASWFLLGSVLWSAGLLGIAFVGLTVLAARRSAISLALTASALFFAGLVTVVLPALEPMWVYKKVAAELQGREYSQIAFVGFEEPSAIFTFGTHTQLLDAEAAAQLLADDPSAVVIEAVRDGKEPSLATPESSTFDGFNYARGQHLRFYIAENTLSSSSAG